MIPLTHTRTVELTLTLTATYTPEQRRMHDCPPSPAWVDDLDIERVELSMYLAPGKVGEIVLYNAKVDGIMPAVLDRLLAAIEPDVIEAMHEEAVR